MIDDDDDDGGGDDDSDHDHDDDDDDYDDDDDATQYPYFSAGMEMKQFSSHWRLTSLRLWPASFDTAWCKLLKSTGLQSIDFAGACDVSAVHRS